MIRDYEIPTDQLEKIIYGAGSITGTIQLDKKCTLVIDYDPDLRKVDINSYVENLDT